MANNNSIQSYLILGVLAYGAYSYETKGLVYTLFHPLQAATNAASDAAKTASNAVSNGETQSMLSVTDGVASSSPSGNAGDSTITLSPGVTVTDLDLYDADSQVYLFTLSNDANIFVSRTQQPTLYNQLNTLYEQNLQSGSNAVYNASVDALMNGYAIMG